MANYLINDTQLTSVADAIRTKSGGSAGLTFPSGFISEIGNISTGGGSGPITGNDVRFYDYDGTLFAGYSAADFVELTEMPANPSHEGLTAQGWNWSLANAKAYVAKYGRLNIGQMYITDDGKTRIYIHLEKGRTSPMLGVCPNGTVDVDWGDGTAHDTLTGTSTTTVKWTPTHNYAAPGDYVIKLTVTGSMGLLGSGAAIQGSGILRYNSPGNYINYTYRDAVKRVEIGNGVTSIGSSAFNYCGTLTSVTIPDGITSIGSNAFNCCYSLTNVIIPDGATSIDNSAFSNCYSLASIIIPNGVTSIGSGVFQYCGSLTSVTIPDGVTSIGSNAFNCCYALASATIPDSITSINDYAFIGCASLINVVIPDGVTSISGNAFGDCHSFTNVTIPDSVTHIGDSVFSGCYGVAEYHLFPITPPTLAYASAFNKIPDDCIIYVPQGSLEAYQTATNWSTYADHMQEEPQ